VVAPPYDVLDSDEARALAAGNDLTWLHVSKPEIDLDPAIDLYDDRVYAKAIANYLALLERGALLREENPAYYVYRLSIGGRSQTGILAGAAVAEYEKDLIKKHELTRADKETDRTRHTRTLDAHTGPVFLVYRKSPAIDALVEAITSAPPIYDVTTHDGVRNELWVAAETEVLRSAFAALPCLYIADGHHRAASYSRHGAERRAADPAPRGDEPYNFFLAVLFPHDQLRIMPYNRVVEDLNGLSEETFLAKVRERFALSESASASPDRRHRIAMHLGGRWMGLEPLPGTFDASDPVKSLDVSILQENLLAPILGIEDPRRDQRIDFVGGIRGTEELERRVGECSAPAVAFSMYPTSVEELMAISDAGKIMPPKSTWFEPKLKDGFVIHELTERPLGAPRR
jgi:uncharacterized protein (DUF1015 family)